MTRRFVPLFVLTMATVPVTLRAEDAPPVVPLWPGSVPGELKPIDAEKYVPSKPEELCQKKLTNVSVPTITVYRPSREKDTGTSVVIAPGGGYRILAMDLEGEEVAAWLNSIGVTGILLKYRVPQRDGEAQDKPSLGAFQDAQRAVRVVRSKAREWDLDPARVGMLGFSAGGHLTARTATNTDRSSYKNVDETDTLSCRPDFIILVYPAYLANEKDPVALSAEIRVASDTPPCFIAHAYDDPITVENSLRLALALKRAGVPCDLHVYARGGHGFGLRASDRPCSTWPVRCAEWLRDRGLLTPTTSR